MGKTVFQLSPDGGTTKYDLRDSNIAPIELDSAHASQPYAVNEEFVLDADGLLYEATSPISQGSAIIVYPTSGYNCKLSDSVTGQIKAVKDSLGTASTKNSTSVVTESTDLVESGAVKDIVGWSAKNEFDINACYDFANSVVSNNSFVNNATDSRAANFMVGAFKNGTYLGAIFPPVTLTQTGKYEFDLPLTGTFGDIDSLIFGHNGQNHDIKAKYHFNKSGNYKISFRATGLDLSTVGGYVLTDIMIYDASILDSTYEPYHASVEESLAEKTDNTVIAPVENGSTASQAYAVGSHAIRNGAFITWKNAKSQGETINDASDYTAGDVADELEVSLVTCVTEKHPNITINSSRNNLFRYGKLRFVDVGFTVNSDISMASSTALFTLSDASIGVFSFMIQRGSSPYEQMTNYSLYTNGGRYVNANNITIPAGNYVMSGFYLGN